MQRLQRINRTIRDLGICETTDSQKCFDNNIKAIFRLNDNEWNYLCDNITSNEMELLTQTDDYTYSQKRKVITILDKYLIDLY